MTPQKYANLRSEAAGFITDWLMEPGDSQRATFTIEVAELDRGAQIIEAQMHEIDRLTTDAESVWDGFIERGFEIDRLQRWKTEVIEVIGRWDAVASLVPFDSSTLGQSKADVVKNEIDRLQGLVRSHHKLDDVDEEAWWCTCGLTNYDMHVRRASRPHADHAAHVESVLRGDA